jgi:hypothetical protein
MMQRQQQPALQQEQQQQQQQDPRLQRLAAAMEGMRAATAAADASSSGAVDEVCSTQGLILSAGLDRSMVLWSMKGARVGAFGSDTWQLQDTSTWQDPSGCSSEVGCDGRVPYKVQLDLTHSWLVGGLHSETMCTQHVHSACARRLGDYTSVLHVVVHTCHAHPT